MAGKNRKRSSKDPDYDIFKKTTLVLWPHFSKNRKIGIITQVSND